MLNIVILKDVNSVLRRINDLGYPLCNVGSNLTILIFYDLNCPACTKMELELGDYIMEIATKKLANVYYMDFPVHRGIERLHAAIRYISNDNPQLFKDLIRKVYIQFREFRKIDLGIDEEIMRKAEELVKKVLECKSFGKELGISGTPAMAIILSKGSVGIGLVIEGYWGRDMRKLIEKIVTRESGLFKL